MEMDIAAGQNPESQPQDPSGARREAVRRALRDGRIVALALSAALNLALLQALLLPRGAPAGHWSLARGLPFALAWSLLALLLVLLFGLAIALAVFRGRQGPWAGYWAELALAGLLAAQPLGCPLCPAPSLTIGDLALPLAGLEVKAFALLLLTSALWRMARPAGHVAIAAGAVGQEADEAKSPRPVRVSRPSAAWILISLLLLSLLPPLTVVQSQPAGPIQPAAPAAAQPELGVERIIEQVNPPAGFELPVSMGAIGPALVQAGAIDLERMQRLYAERGQPLSADQIRMLTEGEEGNLVISQANAPFLLNVLWALGLVTKNPILDEGPMMAYSEGDITRFASTGGWTLGAKPVAELYSSTPILRLTPEQQARLERVASAVYRPCCNNPTAFPDCNHGMAMLGLLEMMAAADASEAEMFAAAKMANAFWFPQQAMEVAIYFQAVEGIDFAAVDPRAAVGAEMASASGFRGLRTWLGERGLLGEGRQGGGSCGV